MSFFSLFLSSLPKWRKSQKNQPQTSKIGPKCSQNGAPGLTFSIFWKPCFRTTLQWFCLFFQVLGGPGATKNQLKTASRKKHLENTRFLAKTTKKLKKGLLFRSFLAPFSYFLRFRRPRVPKGVPKPPRDSQSAKKKH